MGISPIDVRVQHARRLGENEREALGILLYPAGELLAGRESPLSSPGSILGGVARATLALEALGVFGGAAAGLVSAFSFFCHRDSIETLPQSAIEL